MLPRFLSCPSSVSVWRRGISSNAAHDKKMEALVSLYHQSNTFITPENLSSVIDQAFTQSTHITEEKANHTFRELHEMRTYMKNSRQFFLGRDDGSAANSSESMGPGWTESKSRRVDRVYQTLMGTQKDGRPSWLALKENSERVKCQLDKDKRRE